MPSSPYKSRLLTVLSERSLKLRDQAQRRLRQAKTAAAWSAQIVLYPVYAAFQSTRVVSRQIGQTARRVFPQIQSAAQTVKQTVDPSPQPVPSGALPTSDSPIRHTLRSLDLLALPLPVTSVRTAIASPAPTPELPLDPASQLDLVQANAVQTDAIQTNAVQANSTQLGPAPAEPQPSAMQPPSAPKIRGIACLTDSQRLVLVDQNNAVHDLLTPAQAAHLQRRLVLELAKFWQVHKRFQLAHQPAVPLPLPRDRQTMLPPVRAWRRLMAWMQTSPVAVSTNLFQEALLAESLSSLAGDGEGALLGGTNFKPLLEASSQPLPQPALGGVPASALPPTAADAASWWSRLIPAWMQPQSSDIASPPRWFDPDHQGDSKGWKNANQIAQDHQAQLPPVRPSLPIPATQRWAGLWPWGKSGNIPAGDSLALEDAEPGDLAQLYDDSPSAEAGELTLTQASTPKAPQANVLANSTSSSPSPEYRAAPDLLNEIEQYLRGLLGGETAPKSELALELIQDSDMASGPDVPTGGGPLTPRGEAESERALGGSLEDDSDTSITLSTGTQGLQTTWLETKATPLGYERHFLEQVLQWVDQSLVWIETRLVKLLQWLNPSR